MVDDISAALLYQVKKEIAERYFGTRKLIEEERAVLSEHVKVHKETAGKALFSVLGTIYKLLGCQEYIDEFWEITGTDPQNACERFPPEIVGNYTCPPDLTTHGLTERGRYKNFIINCYKRLQIDARKYRQSYEDIMDECLLINEQMGRLRSSYNLDEILRFVRSIEDFGSLAGTLGENIVPNAHADLEAKLAIPKLECMGKEVAQVPVFPPLSQIKPRLKQLAGKAYERMRGGEN